MDGKEMGRARQRSTAKLLIAASLGVAVCAAIFAPEPGASAFAGLSSQISGLISVIAFVALVLFVAAICTVCFAGATLGRSIKDHIMRIDREAIGVDVTIGNLVVAVHTGKVEVHDVKLANPEPYSSEYLLKAGHVKVDIDMWQLLRTRMRQITIQSLVFEDVDAIWEKSGITHSNIKAILQFLHDKKGQEGQEQQQQQQRSLAAHDTAPTPHNDAAPGKHFAIKELVIRDVGVKLASHLFAGAGVRMALGDIAIVDLNRSLDHGMAAEIAREVLTSVLKTIVANTAGKSIGDELF